MGFPALILFWMLGASQVWGQTPTPVNVLTWRYDTTHQGQNTQETLLTPANVTPGSFGKLFSQAVDGYVYAQPLYVSGLTMGDGLVHNVIFVATEHDSIYAFDADTNGGANAFPLWQISLLSPAYGAGPTGVTTVPSSDLGTSDLVPEIGITGTPAINLAAQTLYVVGATKENGVYYQRLHAINIVTGAEQPGSPVAIQASVPGTGNGSSGGMLPFSPLWSMNRGALDFSNGFVYIPFGSHGDNGPWHGWVFAYNATTLAQTGVLCTSPNGIGNGVWSAGAGLPIDPDAGFNRLFLVTGNGTYGGYPPIGAGSDFGDSVVDVSLANGALTATDAFTVFNQATLSTADLDQGSGGILLLPDQPGSYPHELVQVGKEGRILVLNRDSLGGYAPGGTNNANAVQDVPGLLGGLWSTPAYWNGNVYFWGSADYGKSFALNGGTLTTPNSSATPFKSQFPSPSFVISSNGTQSGIAWAARVDEYLSNGPEILYAFDATNLANVLYESDTLARDYAGTANKFAVPVITNGKVYLGAAYQVDVYGLLSGEPVAGVPAISPNGGSFQSTQQVTLTTSTPTANIYYTLDGSVPTPSSQLYSGPIAITAATTVRALASAPGYLQSAVATAFFEAGDQAPPVTASPSAGTYNTLQVVALSDSDPSATIYYTLDGSTPTAASAVYSSPITVASSTVINAIAIDPQLALPSNVVRAPFVISPSGTFIDFGSGFSSVTGLTLNGYANNNDDSRLQLTTGFPNEAGSAFFAQPVNVQAFSTNFTFQLSNAIADGFTFTIQNAGPTAIGQAGEALGYSYNSAGNGAIKNSVAIKFDIHNNAGEGNDSTGVYLGGAMPTVPAVNIAPSGIQLASGDAIQAAISYDGATLTLTLTDVIVGKTFTYSTPVNIPQAVGGNTAYVGFTGGSGGSGASQKILTWTYAAQTAVNATSAPLFSVAAGFYSAPQTVTLASATPGAAIYYTLNGTTPTAASTLYTGPVTVGYGNITLEAIAQAPGLSPSSAASETFLIVQPLTPAPALTPGSGSFAAGQTVTMADSDPSAVIYYTLDGSQPSAASAVYSGPLTLSASVVVNAVAIDPAMQASGVATASYFVSSGAAGAIGFASGFPNATNLTLNGSATVTNNAVQLTGAANQAGSVFWSTPVNIQGFSASFSFQLVKAVADGFTFTLQNSGPKALGQNGSSLGYGSTSASSGLTANSLALKFDIHNNAGEGTNSTGIFTNGAVPTTPAIAIPASAVVLASGDAIQALLTYDGTTLAMSLTDTVTNKTFTQSFPVNIPQIVGNTTAYVGFTGGTGGSFATQEILNWTFTPQTPATVTAAPSFSIAAGSYSSPQSVTLASATPGAAIYYTTNGTTPTTGSTLYAGPVPIGYGNTTIEAIAVASGYSPSPVANEAFAIAQPVTPAPTLSPGSGTYASGQTVTLADSDPSAVIYYTLDGSQPSAASKIYTTPLSLSASTAINAVAIDPADLPSAASGATYAISSGAPGSIGFANGFPSALGLGLNGSAAVTNNLLQLTGSTNQAGSAFWTTPVNIQSFSTSFSFQLGKAVADGFTFTIQNYGPTALGLTGSSLGYGSTSAKSGLTAGSVALKFDIHNNAGEGNNSTGLYTDGATPTIPAVAIPATTVALASGDTIQALVTYDGTTLSLILTDTATSKTFTQSFPVNIPQIVGNTTAYVGFTGGTGGSYAIQDILNWTFANTPTGGAAAQLRPAGILSGPKPLAGLPAGGADSGIGEEAGAAAARPESSEDRNASLAVSVPAGAADGKGGQIEEPRFRPTPGEVADKTGIELGCATPGAIIHFTVDGSQPTRNSPIFRAPVVVSGTSLTIKAFAEGPDADSAVVTGSYRVKQP